MEEKDVIISDVEYLYAERLSEAYMNKILDAAFDYIKIIKKLTDDGINDEYIKSALTQLGNPLVRLLQSYRGESNFINYKMQNFITKIDEIDTFIY